jgi:hypothetical protein
VSLLAFDRFFSPSLEVPIILFLDICRQCNRRQIQAFGVEYVVVFAKKNNNYVETEMEIVKKAFWAVACSNFIAYLSEWHFFKNFCSILESVTTNALLSMISGW